MISLICDGTNREPFATVDVEPIEDVGIEVRAPRAARGVRNEGRRPVADVGPRTEEVRAAPVASGGKEDAVAVGCCHQSSIDPGSPAKFRV